MFASESVPGLNKYFQLVSFPSDEFRDYILKLLAADVLLTFIMDRLLKLIFAPQILFASMKGTSMKDVFKLAKTGAIILFLMWTFLGNEETWEEMLSEEGVDGETASDMLNGGDSVPEVTPSLGGFEEL
jgi:cation-transporting ATPase 13A1